jgi:predicted transposase YdaD
MPLSHDQFFQRVFAHADHVRAFLQGILLPQELATLDLSTLERLPETLVTPALEKSLADVVWRCSLRGAPAARSKALDEHAHLCLLLEHKSSSRQPPHLQLLQYMLGLWQHQWEKDGKLHPVLPLLFHQGRRPLRLKPMASAISHLPDWLVPHTPLFTPRLADLAAIGYPEIPRRFPEPELQLDLTAMKWVVDRLPATCLAEAFVRLPRKTELKELDALITYIGEKRAPGTEGPPLLTPQEILTMSEGRPKKEKAMMMSLFDILRAEGVEQGMEKGRNAGLSEGAQTAKLEDARKMKEHGIAAEVIAEITGLGPTDY